MAFDPVFLENFGSGAGGGFIGVLLGWWTLKSRLESLSGELAKKADQADVEHVREITQGLVREKTCLARTEGLANTMAEKIEGVSDKLGARVDALSSRMDNSIHRFDRLEEKIDRIRDMLLVPMEERSRKL